jgi:peptidylprolyl isomerase
MVRRRIVGVALAACWALGAPVWAQTPPPSSLQTILDASPAADWRPIDPANTVYLTLPQGRVVIEVAPTFAPRHVANLKLLAGAKFFDGLFVVRSQDNYVVQWGDAEAKKPLGGASRSLKAEFDHAYGPAENFTPLPDPDTYAPQVGFTDGFPAARDPVTGKAWLTHCYGMVGAGRDLDADSGSAAELYAVIGQAPRQLDRNVTLLGRVVEGMDILSALPRGHGDLGFYQTPGERVPIAAMRLGLDVPAAERVKLEALRTDSATFAALVQNRRFRKDAFYKLAAGRIDICNVPLPVRVVK